MPNSLSLSLMCHIILPCITASSNHLFPLKSVGITYFLDRFPPSSLLIAAIRPHYDVYITHHLKINSQSENGRQSILLSLLSSSLLFSSLFRLADSQNIFSKEREISGRRANSPTLNFQDFKDFKSFEVVEI